MDIKIILNEHCEDASYFINPSYEGAIIGISSDGKVVYSYRKMVEELVNNEEITEEEAIDWIDFNVLRSLPYMGEKEPIIVYDMEMFQ